MTRGTQEFIVLVVGGVLCAGLGILTLLEFFLSVPAIPGVVVSFFVIAWWILLFAPKVWR